MNWKNISKAITRTNESESSPRQPTPTTPKALEEVTKGQSTKVGRHDACVAVRAVPVVEAMTALALVQFL